MKSLEINNTAVDLSLQDVPFLSNYNVVAINGSATQRVVQGSVDQAFTVPVTLATLAAAGTAGAIQTIQLTYQWIRTSAATSPVTLLGN